MGKLDKTLIFAKKAGKGLVYYGTGWGGLKSACLDLSDSVARPLNSIQGLLSSYRKAREAHAADFRLTDLDPDAKWDLMVSDYKITTASARRSYLIATWLNIALVLILAALSGVILSYAFGYMHASKAVIISIGCFFNLALMFLLDNANTLNLTYNQSVPTQRQFFKSVLRRPQLLVFRPLPRDYRVRGETK